MRATLALIPLVVLGCASGAPGAGGPTPAVGAVVDLTKVTISKPVDGVVKVSGAPGTVSGAPATTVTLTIVRESAPPVAYRLQHLSGSLPVGSNYATLAADGGFGETSIGTADRPVQSKDELNITAQKGTAQAGFTFYTPIP